MKFYLLGVLLNALLLVSVNASESSSDLPLTDTMYLIGAAAEAAPKAALASRTNTLFSIPMLWFMVASAHMPSGSIMANTQAIVICCVIIAAIEVNAIYGKQYTMTTVKGVIASGLVLTVILAGILRMF